MKINCSNYWLFLNDHFGNKISTFFLLKILSNPHFFPISSFLYKTYVLFVINDQMDQQLIWTMNWITKSQDYPDILHYGCDLNIMECLFHFLMQILNFPINYIFFQVQCIQYLGHPINGINVYSICCFLFIEAVNNNCFKLNFNRRSSRLFFGLF